MKIITHDSAGELIVQGTDAWKQLRVGMLTASTIKDILKGKRGGCLEAREKALRSMVWERLTGLPETGFFGGKYVKDGVEREPFARMGYEARFGVVVEETAFIQHDWMQVGVSLDGWVPRERRNLEIKCPKDTTHLEYLALDETPEEYKAQVQAQLWVTGFEVCDFVSYHPDGDKLGEGLDLHVIEVPRDEPYIKMIEAEATLFLAEVNVRVKAIQERGIFLDLQTQKRLQKEEATA